MKNVQDRSCRENQNTFYVPITFFFKIIPLWDNVEKYCTGRQATDDSTAHAHCVLDSLSCSKHTLKVCNTYCVSSATVVTHTPLSFTLYIHCLSCVNLILIMNKTKAVRNTNLLFFFVFPDFTLSLILQFCSEVYMMMWNRGFTVIGLDLYIVSEILFFVSFFWAFFHTRLSPTIELGFIHYTLLVVYLRMLYK